MVHGYTYQNQLKYRMPQKRSKIYSSESISSEIIKLKIGKRMKKISLKFKMNHQFQMDYLAQDIHLGLF